jgi:hypothetical protein
VTTAENLQCIITPSQLQSKYVVIEASLHNPRTKKKKKRKRKGEIDWACGMHETD